jgi:putative ATP-binding cassette transporter
MEFLKFLKREGGVSTSRLLVVAGSSGLLSGVLVILLLKSAKMAYRSSGQAASLFLFIALFACLVFCQRYTLAQTTRITEGIIHRLRLRIADQVRRSELLGFESIGASAIRTVLTDHTRILFDAAQGVTRTVTSFLIVTFGLAYICLLSFKAFLVIAAIWGGGVVLFHRNLKVASAGVRAAAVEEQEFYRQMDHLLDGFKQLKVDARQSATFFQEDLKRLADRAHQIRLEACARYDRNLAFANSFLYGLMGLMIFIVPAVMTVPKSATFVELITVLLFMSGPVGDVASASRYLQMGEMAIERIEGLEAALGTRPAPQSDTRTEPPRFESLECRGLTFRYPETGGRTPFQVGPIDLEVRRGEIIFLVGGNGSGKSTLFKLLTGLYPQSAGELRFNGRLVTGELLTQYRSLFSIILQDFHLFDRIFSSGLAQSRARIDELLTALELGEVTGVSEDGRFENIQLSQGQKKRLALLVADLEDHDVLVFDEWAADQDPEFRQYFYNVLLRDLAARGKTIIAATHDDRYFHLADRVIKMSEGRVESVMQGRQMTPLLEVLG